MKRYIKSNEDIVTLYKFILVQMDMLPDQPDNYDEVLQGYFYIWPYTYNTVTDTVDESLDQSDVIDELPVEIRRVCNKNCIWGETESLRGHTYFFINNSFALSKQQLKYIKQQCKMQNVW